jgi:uncharacterized protein (PEP-CTERM system associated)
MLRLGRIGLCCLLLSTATDLWAGRWHVRLTKAVDFDTGFSGNVFLDAPQETTQESITRVRPRLSAERRGGRGSASIQYAPELRYFASGSQSTRIVHFLDANGNVDLLRRRLGLRATARAAQSIIDRNAVFTPDGLTTPENITNTYSLSISPYLYPIRFGRYATLNVTTDLNFVVNSDSRATDSRGNSVGISLVSGPYYSPFSWSLATRRQVTLFQDADQNTLNTVTGTLGYRINRRWQLVSVFGYDDSNIQTTRDINGFSWRLDVTYQPTSRSSLTLGYGERFGSEDYRLDLRTRHKHSSWTAGFTRQIQTAGDEFLTRPLFATTDAFGRPIADPTGDEASFNVFPGPSFNDAIYLSDRFRLSWGWSRRRTSATINLDYTQRDDLRVEDMTSDLVTGLRLGRRLTSKSSLNLGVTWLSHDDSTDPSAHYQLWSGNLDWSRELFRSTTSTTSLRLRYQVTVRDADSGEDFKEDRISLGMTTSYQ